MVKSFYQDGGYQYSKQPDIDLLDDENLTTVTETNRGIKS